MFENIYDNIMICEPQDIYEDRIQSAWNNINAGYHFTSIKGDNILVYSPGTWNTEAGPDFLNAKIAVNGKIIVGDIEIHYQTSDWKHHKHSEDIGYKNVILHVVSKHNSFEGAPKIPTIIIQPDKKNINCDLINKIKNGQCAEDFTKMNDSDIKTFFFSAGLERFLLKSDIIIKDILSKGADVTLLELIFDTMGYKKNRENFNLLFKRYMSYDENDRIKLGKYILWGESGLMPDPTQTKLSNEVNSFLRNIWTKWWEILPESHSPITWKNSGGRPVNSPARRVAALILLLEIIGNNPIDYFIKLIQTIPPENLWKELFNKFIIQDEFWDNHINFLTKRKSPATILGKMRLLDMTINAILPSLYAYAKVSRNQKLANYAKEAWLTLPASQSNKIIQNATHRWFENPKDANKMIKTATVQQGIIHLYKNLCEKNHTDCNVCNLGLAKK